MYSVVKAMAKMQQAGLPVTGVKALPDSTTAAVKTMRTILKVYGVGRLCADKDISSAASIFLSYKDSTEHIAEKFSNFKYRPACLTEAPRRCPFYRMGMINIEENNPARIYFDVAPQINLNNHNPELDGYHILTRGALTPSHTFIKEPGKLWRIVKHAGEDGKLQPGAYETDLAIGKEILRNMLENDYVTPLLKLSETFGDYSATFFYMPRGRMIFIHPLIPGFLAAD